MTTDYDAYRAMADLEEAEKTLLGLVSLWIHTLTRDGVPSTLLTLACVVVRWPKKWPKLCSPRPLRRSSWSKNQRALIYIARVGC